MEFRIAGPWLAALTREREHSCDVYTCRALADALNELCHPPDVKLTRVSFVGALLPVSEQIESMIKVASHVHYGRSIYPY